MLPQHYRTAFSAQTGTSLKRQPPTTTTQTCRSTLKLWVLISKSTVNHFYSWFEMQNDTPAQKLPIPPTDQALCLSPADVRKTLSRINLRKAVCPDNIPGHVLRDCAVQLTDVLTDIFNTSLSQAVVPTSQIHNNHTGTKEITCVLSKWLLSLSTDSNHDEVLWEVNHAQHQNQPPQHTRSAPVCIPFKPLYRWCNFLHLALTHLENKDSYVRMMFIDFSSAFNTIIPQQLINPLESINAYTRFEAFSPDNPEKNLNYPFSFDRTDKSNTSIESVKGLLLFVSTHNNNKTLCIYKI